MFCYYNIKLFIICYNFRLLRSLLILLTRVIIDGDAAAATAIAVTAAAAACYN